MFSKSLLDGLFNIQPYDLKRKTNQSFNLMDHISKDISDKDLNKLYSIIDFISNCGLPPIK